MGVVSQPANSMAAYKESIICVFLLSVAAVFGSPLPQFSVSAPGHITEQHLLTPLHVVRNTGRTAAGVGSTVIHGVPTAVNTVSNTAIRGVNFLPHTVNAINAVPDAVINAPTHVGNAVVTAAQVPGQFFDFGFSGVRAIPHVTGSVLRTGTSVLANTPHQVISATGNVVQSGAHFVRAAPTNIINAPGTLVRAGVSGVRTVANDGSTIITSTPHHALRLTGTAVRTGGALLSGGTRTVFATGNSLVQSGFNAVHGGGRVLLATASVPGRFANSAFGSA